MTPPHATRAAEVPAAARPDWRSDVLDVLCAIVRHRLIIAGVLVVAAVGGLTAGYLSEPFYRASATFVLLPREKPVLDVAVQSASIETSDDAAKRSDAATLTLPPNPELYTSLIRSASVAERVAAACVNQGLSEAIDPSEIRDMLKVEATEAGVIKLTAQTEDAELAAFVVNTLVAECEDASKLIERQLILQQAGYLESAIEVAEQRLTTAQQRLARYAERHGIGNVRDAAARSSALLKTLSDTEASLSRELDRLMVSRTEVSPDVRALRAELRQVRFDLSRTRSAYVGTVSENDYAELASTWSSLEQDVRLRQDMVMSMRARHDVFKIRADQPAGNLALIRPASVPSVPAGPSKRRFLVLACLAGGLLALAAAVGAEQLRGMRKDKANRSKIDELLNMLPGADAVRRMQPTVRRSNKREVV